MSDKKLDNFIVKRTAAAMERIEQEIYKEVREAICEHFGVVSIRNLTDDQVRQVKEAKKARDKGFLRLGYNLVLKQLRRSF